MATSVDHSADVPPIQNPGQLLLSLTEAEVREVVVWGSRQTPSWLVEPEMADDGRVWLTVSRSIGAEPAFDIANTAQGFIVVLLCRTPAGHVVQHPDTQGAVFPTVCEAMAFGCTLAAKQEAQARIQNIVKD